MQGLNIYNECPFRVFTRVMCSLVEAEYLDKGSGQLRVREISCWVKVDCFDGRSGHPRVENRDRAVD